MKNWPLLEKVAPGPIKDNLIGIKECLERIEKVRDILSPLAHFSAKTDTETITVANETVFSIVAMIDADVDSVFHHLNLIFEKDEPQAAGSAKADVIDMLITILQNKDKFSPELLATLKSQINEAHQEHFGGEAQATAPGTKEAHASLSLAELDNINLKMGELSTLVGVLVAAGEGNSEFDTAGFAYMMEEKFEGLFNAYHEATGQPERYECHSTK